MGRRPLVLVALVQGVDLALGRNLHLGVRQHELANGRVQHETVHFLQDKINKNRHLRQFHDIIIHQYPDQLVSLAANTVASTTLPI